jgi:hypothetical protein
MIFLMFETSGVNHNITFRMRAEKKIEISKKL